jgi:hypothetical protein
MTSIAADVMAWPRRLRTLASRIQRRDAAQEGSFWRWAKGHHLLPKDINTAGAHHVLDQQQAASTDSMLEQQTAYLQHQGILPVLFSAMRRREKEPYRHFSRQSSCIITLLALLELFLNSWRYPNSLGRYQRPRHHHFSSQQLLGPC